MTNKEALQSLVEYENDNLLEKVLLDNSLTGSDVYSLSNKDVIELCSAYVYKSLISFPDFSEGKLRIKYDAKALTAIANDIFDKNNLPNEKIGIVKPTLKFKVL